MSKLIVIDGGECVGKGTQMRLLMKSWDTLFPQQKAIFTREPGGSPFAEEIRGLVLGKGGGQSNAATQFCLMVAARFEHVERVIAPAIQEGTAVISDRFESTTFAFQVYAEDSVDLEDMYNAHKSLLRQKLPGGWHTILLDMEPDEALKRLAGRTNQDINHFDQDAVEVHMRRREGFLEYARLNPDDVTVLKVDGQSPEEVHLRLVERIRELLAQ